MRELKKFLIITALLTYVLSCSDDSEEPDIPDTVAPTVSLTIAGISNMISGEPIIVSNQIEVSVDAEDEGGISKIEAFINNEKVGEDTTAPYTIVIDISSYDSKSSKTYNYKEYVLKVVATDLSGNSSSTEEEIFIDNELPSITEVSLEEGTILHGDSNVVTFEVTDNEELSSVSAFLNGELLSEITDESYEFTLNTSTFSHGENLLLIEAKDAAGNLGTHTVTFIVDNTGPSITLQSLVEGQILDETASLQPIVSDTYSNVASVEILYNETSLVLFDNTATSYAVDFNPESQSTGEGALIVIATDTLGNTNQKTININILRLLVKFSIPDGYLSPNIQTNHFVFASEVDGSPIDLEEIIFETREVKLHAIGEFENDKAFTLTFASLGLNGVASYLYSVANLNREQPKQLNLEVPKRFGGQGGTYYPITGFSETAQLSCFGRDYYFSSSAEGNTLITDFLPTNHNLRSGPVYIYSFNPLNNFYNYTTVDRPIPSDFEMDFDNFSTQNIESRQLTTSPVSFYNENAKSLAVFGYRSQEDMENDFYHQLWGYGYGEHVSNNNLTYPLNTEFFEYSHRLSIGNYHSRGLGLPKEIIEIPDWSIDYTFQNNSITLLKSGVGHTNGEVLIGDGHRTSNPYEWNIIFDSGTVEEIVLPQIPIQLQNFNVYNTYENAEFEILRVALMKYNAVETYSDYLENILKPNKSFGRSAPQFEAIFNGETYCNLSNPGYFFNWW